jgi:hypothetical protein
LRRPVDRSKPARDGGFPADSVTVVAAIIGPATLGATAQVGDARRLSDDLA